VFYRNTYRHRSIPHIMREIRQVRQRTRFLYFIDDNFIVNPSHVLGLCEAIIKERMNMFFMTTARADMVTKRPDVFEKMAKAGFIFLLLGFESFSNKTLKKLNKCFQFQEIKTAIRTLHDLGYMIQGNMILGANLDDTEKDLESTIEIAKSLNIDFPTFSILTPYPGTQLMDEVLAKDLLLSNDWCKYTWFNPLIKYENLTSEQLLKYLDKAYSEVPVFKKPFLRLLKIYHARGLGFLLPRFCNISTLKTAIPRIKNLFNNKKMN